MRKRILRVHNTMQNLLSLILLFLLMVIGNALIEEPNLINELESGEIVRNIPASPDVLDTGNIPAVERKFGLDDTVASDPISVNKFIEEFHQQIKEEQQALLIAKENLESSLDEGVYETKVASDELTVTNSTSNSSEYAAAPVEDANNASSILVSCVTGKESGGEPVELVNSTRLMNILITESNITNRRSLADCVAVLFYARYCPFSCMAAPHFNALHRAYPDIKMAAVDAMKHPSFNTQYGIVGVPTVMLFHNGRPAAKFNDSEYTLEIFAKFITKYTGLEPQHKLYVTSADFGGPVPSVPTKETDYCLVLSWVFIVVCAVYYFSKSAWWRWIVETVQNTWREAEAQHEHVD